jgi:subtilisin family serine protease
MRPNSHRWSWRIALLLVLFLGGLLHIASAGLLSGSSKLESSLAKLAALAQQGQTVRAQELAVQYGIHLQADAITAVIEPEGHRSTAIDERALGALGAQIEARSPELLRAHLPLARLQEIADRVPGIAFIRRPYRWAPLGEASLGIQQLSQGLVPTGAYLFQSQGFKGQGAKVAVIDAGFSGLYLAVKRRVISATAIAFTKDYTGEGFLTGGEHGAAVAEIVHEMAPQAQLYLMKIGDEVDLANAVNDAIRLGVRIISHSLGWFDADFGDGKGVINDIVRHARAQGILWVNAAGNQADAHWIGRFRDHNQDGWAEFGLNNQALALDAPLGGLIDLVLTWDDWPVTDQDYDLFLTDAPGKVLASSEDRQTGSQPPREEIQYVADHPGVFYVRVHAYRANRPMWLRLFEIESGPTFRTPTPHMSIVAPADCTCAVAVGAVNIENWLTGPQEPFSALGPTFDGRIKPDIAGPDGVNNLFFSEQLGGFLGTSAAAPHVAGAAALLLSQHPDWTADQLEAALRDGAFPLGSPDDYGAGALDLVFGWPSAERHIASSGFDKIRTGVQPGEHLSVSLTLQMPPERFGSLQLREELPAGFRLQPVDNAGAQFDPAHFEWIWSIVDPGRTLRVQYLLEIPADASLGVYQLHGTINGRPVGGDMTISVIQGKAAGSARQIEPLVTSAAISWPAPLGEKAGGARRVEIFDLAGNVTFTVQAEAHRALVWPLIDGQGRPVASGVYLYLIEHLTPDGRVLSGPFQKLVVLRR